MDRVFLVCINEGNPYGGFFPMRIQKVFDSKDKAKDYILDPQNYVAYYHFDKHPKLAYVKDEQAFYGKFADGTMLEIRIISKEVN